jgi:hypothetical protein
MWYGTRQVGSGSTPVYRSTDAGRSWQSAAAPLPFIVAMIQSRFARSTLYAGSQAWPALCVSRDDGRTWTPLSFGSARPDLEGRTDLIPWILVEDPLDGTLYVPLEIGEHPQPYRPPVMRSTDGGATWTDVARWDTGNGYSTTVAWHATGGLVEAGTHVVLMMTEGSRGTYRSTDHGDTWTRINLQRLTGSLLQDPRVTGRYFAKQIPYLNDEGGLFVSTDEAHSFQPFGLGGRACEPFLDATGRRLFAVCENGIYATMLSGWPSSPIRRSHLRGW